MGLTRTMLGDGTGWSRGNSLEFYAGDAGFEHQPGHQIS
jgi:hypothetical protein